MVLSACKHPYNCSSSFGPVCGTITLPWINTNRKQEVNHPPKAPGTNCKNNKKRTVSLIRFFFVTVDHISLFWVLVFYPLSLTFVSISSDFDQCFVSPLSSLSFLIHPQSVSFHSVFISVSLLLSPVLSLLSAPLSPTLPKLYIHFLSTFMPLVHYAFHGVPLNKNETKAHNIFKKFDIWDTSELLWGLTQARLNSYCVLKFKQNAYIWSVMILHYDTV